FFQAEDGIRDLTVTGVQTCALPICPRQPFLGLAIAGAIGIAAADNCPRHSIAVPAIVGALALGAWFARRSLVVYALVAAGFFFQIGRASCRERVEVDGGAQDGNSCF